MSKAVTRQRATPTTVSERVERIAGLMRRLEWQRGETAPVLAKEWGLAVNTVEQLASEASRMVAREVTDPDGLKVEVASVLRANLHRASQAGEFKAVASLGDVVTRIVGARAPERHEHAHVVAHFDALPPPEKARWLREKAAAMLAEADRIENVVSVEVDAGDDAEPV